MFNEKETLILTIDDESAIRESFRNFLEDYDYRVVEAENGRIGLEVFEAEKPDLVLVDLRMPEMDGLQVLAHLSKVAPDTPVIVASGTGVMGDAVEALHLGAWDYLLKPIEDLSVLRHAVEKALERARLIRENRAYQEHLEEEVEKRTHELARTNEALRESEENLAITLDSIGDAVIATDCKGFVTRMNPVAERLTGWTFEEAQGVHLGQVFLVVDADTREPVESPLDMVLGSGRIVELEGNSILISRDRSERRIADSGAPILNKDALIVGVVLVFRDITEQHRLEEQLRQSQKMDAIGQLAGGVAHDFNNMLGGIVGAADLLALRAKGNKTVLKYVNIILEAGKRAAQLTRKLLDFSRKGQTTSDSVDIHRVVKETIRLLERSIDRRIDIKEQLQAHISSVTGDSSQIQNALLNLGINARDAMPMGGTISISTINLTLSEQYCNASVADILPGPYIEICVADTGTGMNRDVQERIFEPFFTTKGVGKGTGLGLTTVYNMVRNHRGDIQVYSQLDKGTLFKIYLPVDQAAETVLNGEHEEEVLKGSGRILVVDDEKIIRTMLEDMLQYLGYDVIMAHDGQHAMEIFKKEKENIDLVILDLIMPKMNGRDVYYAMRNLNPEIRVLISSGFSKDIEVADLLAEGVGGFIRKPFKRSLLSKKINEVLNAPPGTQQTNENEPK